ncbi:MAG: heavy metal-associated domain-containing protein [Saprospiraceae bacterium]
MRIVWMMLAILPLMAMSNLDDALPRTRKAVIKTSAICGMCKTTIEKALSNVEGVQKAALDLVTAKVTVRYDEAKTNIHELRQAISAAGYDADEVPARPKAYENLPACCKKRATAQKAEHH